MRIVSLIMTGITAGTVAALVAAGGAGAAVSPPAGPPGIEAAIDVPGALSFRQVSAGSGHSLGLASDGSVYAWGYGRSGELGDGTTDQRSVPTRVATPSGVVFTRVLAGSETSFAIAADGSLWAWGSNGSGRIGDGTTVDRTRPVKVDGFGGRGVTTVASGPGVSAAVTTDGTLWTWGDNGWGQLGSGTTESAARPNPTKVTALAGKRITHVAIDLTAAWQIMALAEDGSVWAWGANFSGVIGDGTTTQRSAPTEVVALRGHRITSISLSFDNAAAVEADGTAWLWGGNIFGQLGDGTTEPRTTPAPLAALTGTVAQVQVGDQRSWALTTDGAVWGWGWNASGAVGDGTMTNRTKPVPVRGLDGAKVTGISGTFVHALALAADGTAFAWGGNSGTGSGTGALGDGTVNDRSSAVQVLFGVDVTGVRFGSVAGTNLSRVSTALVRATAPAQTTAGPVDVMLSVTDRASGRASVVTLPNGFTYLGAPDCPVG